MLALLQRSSLLLLLLLAFTSGCAGLSRYAEGPEPTGPNEGQARIYFVLEQGFPSGQAFVVENDELLGFIRNKQYFVVDVPAGDHLFMLISEQTEGIRGNWEAGKTYHMKLYVTPGFGSTRVYWSPLEATGEDAKTRAEDLAECKRIELDPEQAAKWEARYRDRNLERVENFNAGKDDYATIEPKHGL